MKTSLPLSCLLSIILCYTLHAQPCSVSISGTKCVDQTLTANVTGGTLAKLTWNIGEGVYYRADTVSSPASISLVAGGHGKGVASNQFSFPAGNIAVDRQGNIYVADYGNNRVQKWAPGATTGVTVAGGHGDGNAANQLSGPRGIFVDKNGNVFVSDSRNGRVQKWKPGATSGITVAGGGNTNGGPKNLNGPAGLYVDAAGDIYIADIYNYRIQKWAHNATEGVTVAGGNSIGTAANQFIHPISVSLDGAGNIYVLDADVEDASHHRVQKWAPGADSGITVIGGNGVGYNANQVGYLLAMTADSAGNVYITDNGVDGAPVSRVQKYTPGATSGITVAGGFTDGWDQLAYPTGVALDKEGNIFVFDGTYNPRVQKYIPTNGIVNNKFAPRLAGKYVAKATFKNGCVATSSVKNIFAIPGILDVEPASPGGKANLCGGGLDTFYVFKQDNVTTYAWSLPAKATLVENRNDSIIVQIQAGFKKGFVAASGTNVCGSSPIDSLRIVGQPFQPDIIIGPSHVTANQTNVSFQVDNLGFTYTWRVPADASIVAGQGTSAVLVNWGSTKGKISVSASNDCGTSFFKNKPIFVTGGAGFAAADESESASKTSITNNNSFIYPNPAVSTATIEFTSDRQTKYIIEVQDITGKTVLHKETIFTIGANKINLDVSRYARGMYVVTVTNASKQKTSFKLVKQ